MYNLPHQTLSGKPGMGENTSISSGFSGVKNRRFNADTPFPSDVTDYRPARVEIPGILFDLDCTDADRVTWRTLDRIMKFPDFNRFGVSMTDEQIAEQAEKLGYAKSFSERTVTKSLATLRRKGLTLHKPHEDDPSQRVIWCRWTWINPAGPIEVGFPLGLKAKIRPGRTDGPRLAFAEPTAQECAPTPLRPTPSAEICAPKAVSKPTRAQKSAEKVLGIASSEATVGVKPGETPDTNTNTNARSAGGEADQAKPEPTPKTEPVVDQVEAIRTGFVEAEAITHRTLKLAAIRRIVTKARRLGRSDLVPLAYAGLENSPDEDPAPKPARPTTKLPAIAPGTVGTTPTGRIEDQQLETLVGKLAGQLGEGERERIAGVCARKIAASYRDPGSENGFLATMRRIGPDKGSLRVDEFFAAYRAGLAEAQKESKKYRPGVKFNLKLRDFAGSVPS